MAIINTTICQKPHCPLNQLLTALYHNNVYGINKNPITGQIFVSKTPANQPDDKYKIIINNLGKNKIGKSMHPIS
jgi:hypothetical protein